MTVRTSMSSLTPGTPVRSQQRLIDVARDKARVADAAARPSSRFHMVATALRSPLEGQLPKTTRRKRKNKH